jgi:hypothetical protein
LGGKRRKIVRTVSYFTIYLLKKVVRFGKNGVLLYRVSYSTNKEEDKHMGLSLEKILPKVGRTM